VHKVNNIFIFTTIRKEKNLMSSRPQEPMGGEVVDYLERPSVEARALIFNTGIAYIVNTTDLTLYVLDGENNHYQAFIDPQDDRDFNEVQIPWCNDANEIAAKAFRFYSYDGGNSYTFLFYLFLNYRNSTVEWATSPIFPGQYAGAPPSSRVSIRVLGDPPNVRPRCKAV
jgi:hypothetical protein